MSDQFRFKRYKRRLIDMKNKDYDYQMEDFLDIILADFSHFQLTKNNELFVFCRPQKTSKSFFNTYDEEIGSRLCRTAKKRGYQCNFNKDGVYIYPLQQPNLQEPKL